MEVQSLFILNEENDLKQTTNHSSYGVRDEKTPFILHCLQIFLEAF